MKRTILTLALVGALAAPAHAGVTMVCDWGKEYAYQASATGGRTEVNPDVTAYHIYCPVRLTLDGETLSGVEECADGQRFAKSFTVIEGDETDGNAVALWRPKTPAWLTEGQQLWGVSFTRHEAVISSAYAKRGLRTPGSTEGGLQWLQCH